MKITAQTFHVSDRAMEHGVHGASGSNSNLIVLPGGDWPLTAQFIRQGPDLLVAGRDLSHIHI